MDIEGGLAFHTYTHCACAPLAAQLQGTAGACSERARTSMRGRISAALTPPQPLSHRQQQQQQQQQPGWAGPWLHPQDLRHVGKADGHPVRVCGRPLQLVDLCTRIVGQHGVEAHVLPCVAGSRRAGGTQRMGGRAARTCAHPCRNGGCQSDGRRSRAHGAREHTGVNSQLGSGGACSTASQLLVRAQALGANKPSFL